VGWSRFATLKAFKVELIMGLTKEQINRQDLIDNEIQGLIEKLNPTDTKIDWDIENISAVRDVLRYIYIEKMNLCSENSFYPFLSE
jgi:hypothetical protein